MRGQKDTLYRQVQMDIPRFVKNVIRRLHKAGFKAYLVGGCIRDFHMARPITDWDVATSASSEDIRSVFKDIRNFSLKHETITLVHEKLNYEITSFRNDSGIIPRIEDDLGRRDFTINAMAYDPEEKRLIDPFKGVSDINKGLVRGVQDPEKRFREDPIRLLRGIRLSVDLDFRIEKHTFESISKMSEGLSSVAQERIRDELIKILLCFKPSRGFDLMRRSGLLKHVVPELLEGYLKRQNHYHRFTVYRHIMETVDRVKPDLVLRLTALFHDIGKPRVRRKLEDGFHFYRHEEESARMAENIMERLNISKGMIGKVSHLVTLHEIYYDKGWSDGAVRRLIRRVGTDNIDDLLALRKADLFAHGIQSNKPDLITELGNRVRELQKRSFVKDLGGLAISGENVMEILGIDQGPDVGRILNCLMEKVTDKPELNTFEQLSTILKSMEEGG